MCSGPHDDVTASYCDLLQGQAISNASPLDSSLTGHDAAASYELRDCPGRWLRRWPRSNCRTCTLCLSIDLECSWRWDDGVVSLLMIMTSIIGIMVVAYARGGLELSVPGPDCMLLCITWC